MSIIDYLKQTIKEHCISPATLCKVAFVSESAMSWYRSGQRHPNLNSWTRILNGFSELGIDVSDAPEYLSDSISKNCKFHCIHTDISLIILKTFMPKGWDSQRFVAEFYSKAMLLHQANPKKYHIVDGMLTFRN